ncbi:NADP-dependent phosphogluconate dehydrogenase [Aurantimonas endophytica]|uniref:6-phosphogluconate dehydrogenase, decarboxylating n=1 Tax=Aurantimonas endophytica TaxID=1522175 RepID=A0A7W6HHK1_9HYPH|nr:NADP-dependent phosphogluconate dehydrogenase [Aurantimonas endophytica]MBB4005410.1 6-phosphogluconate dehydrogenase [Aurantimonas endophytica]MCO6405933.1 NADP-dependent phosphogluconate dehydrogenase [Aurantimonas endophytica]
MSDKTADIGVVGLGTMGSNLALNIAEKGFTVAVHNRTSAKSFALRDDNPGIGDNVVPAASLEDFVASLKQPRLVLFMVPAGKIVDDEMAEIAPLLSPGDVMIDAGNADFHDTVRRSKAVEETGLQFVGMGVSGGELGARHGPSIMVGGAEATYGLLSPILTRIAAQYEGEPCVAWLGPDGAGHFVKTIHNGIEYADMQMIAEIYGIMRDGIGLEPKAMAEIFADWNTRGLSSYLIEITAVTLAETDPETGRPMVDVIVDEAGQKGTGRWAVIEAQKLGVGATTIEAAVSARGVSSRRAERADAGALYVDIATEAGGFAGDAASLTELEEALETAKIIAYAQGYATMAAASDEFSWNLPLAEIARIWRAGCIIRSRFLDDIARAYDSGETVVNLLQAKDFVTRVSAGQGALRRVVAKASLAGIPVPALSAALAYLDDYRRKRGTTDLTQAQRDLFGAHTFHRLDKDGVFHHQWPAV